MSNGKVTAKLRGGERTFDAVSQNPDGSYTGLVVVTAESAAVKLDKAQKEFDDTVNSGKHATGRLGRKKISITSVVVVRVK